MAKKKYEFKPDSSGTGLLSKLYMTQKQRRAVLKWFLYGLVLLVLLVLQDVLLSKLDVGGGTTDLVGCGILMVCLMLGAEDGGVFALVSSCLYLFSGSAPGPYSVVFLTVYGVLTAIFRQSFLRKNFGSIAVCTVITLLLYELSVFAMVLFLGYSTGDRLGGILMTWLLTLVAIPLLYPILAAIDKIGGETWKE